MSRSYIATVSQKWDAAFEQYYKNEIHSDVPSSIGRWVLEELRIYDSYSGVTNNQSEGLNRVIKDLQGWKEAPVDCVMLAVYQLQALYLNEIRRGLAGIGEYHLKSQYASIQANQVWWITFQPALLRRWLRRSRMEKVHESKKFRSRKNHRMTHQVELHLFKHEHNSCWHQIRSALIQNYTCSTSKAPLVLLV